MLFSSKESFGSFIRKKRRNIGQSQAKIAKKVGKHPTYISKMEQGIYIPGLIMAQKLASVLKIEDRSTFLKDIIKLKDKAPEDFLSLTFESIASKDGISEEDLILLKNIHQLSEGGKKHLLQSIEYLLHAEGRKVLQHHDEPLEVKELSQDTINKKGSPYEIDNSQENEKKLIENEKPAIRRPTAKDDLFKEAINLYELGQKKEAYAYFENFIKKKSYSEKSYQSIARFFMQYKDFKQSIKFLKRTEFTEFKTSFLLCESYFENKDFDLAKEQCEISLKNFPEEKNLFSGLLAKIFMEEGEKEKAKEILKDLDPRNCKSIFGCLNLSLICLTLGWTDLSIQYAKQEQTLEESKGEGMKLEGLNYLFSNNLIAFNELAEKFINTYPENSDSYLYKALSASKNNKLNEAMENFELAKNLGLEFNSFIIELIYYFSHNDVSINKCISLFSSFLVNGSPSFYVAYANIYFKEKEIENALNVIERGLQKYKDSNHLYFVKANALKDHVSKQESHDFFQLLFERGALDKYNQVFFAQIKREMGHKDEANKILIDLLNRDPKDVYVIAEMSKISFRNGDFDEGIILKEKLKKLKPEDKLLLNVLDEEQEFFSERYKYGEAITVVDEKLKIITANRKEELLFLKAFFSVRNNEFEKALVILEDCESRSKDDFRIINGLGYTNNFLSNYEKAMIYFKKALSLARQKDDKAIVYSNISYSLSKLGDLNEAELNAQKSLELDPDWHEATLNLARIFFLKEDYAQAKILFENIVISEYEPHLVNTAKKYLERLNAIVSKKSH